MKPITIWEVIMVAVQWVIIWKLIMVAISAIRWVIRAILEQLEAKERSINEAKETE